MTLTFDLSPSKITGHILVRGTTFPQNIMVLLLKDFLKTCSRAFSLMTSGDLDLSPSKTIGHILVPGTTFPQNIMALVLMVFLKTCSQAFALMTSGDLDL